MSIAQEFYKEESSNSNILNSNNINYIIDNIGELFQKCRAYETAENNVLEARKQIERIKLEIKTNAQLSELNGKSDIDEREKLEYSERINMMYKIMKGVVEYKDKPMNNSLIMMYVTNSIVRNIITNIDNKIQKPRVILSRKLKIKIQELLDSLKDIIEEKEYQNKKPGITIPEKISESSKIINEDYQTHIQNLKFLQNEILKVKKS